MSDRSLDRQGNELTYQPALDGLRAVAVLAVLLYHGGVSWAGGGFLGVEAFFVLSGFLITSLLLAEEEGGSVRLGNFWARRARRLLPALFAVVLVTAIYESVIGPVRAVPDFGPDALATLLYVANWHQLWTGSGYFAETGLVSPLQHTWSLAIEEQFYLVWPLALVGLLALGRRLRRGACSARGRLVPLLVVAVLGSLASATEMGLLYRAGAGVNRVYYGTDTRAEGLLAGAALAVAVAMRRRQERAGDVGPERAEAPARLSLRLRGSGAGLVGLLGAVGVGLVLALARSDSAWLFEGGFLALDLFVLGVIVGATARPGVFSPVRSLLSLRPLRAVGLISYGLYLWHFPLMCWLTASSTGTSAAALLWLRLGASLGAAVISFFLVEQPVRRRRLSGLALRVAAPVAASLCLAALLVVWTAGDAVASAPPVAAPPAPQGGASCRADVGGTTELFELCPPIRLLVVGDSIGLTIGIQIGFSASSYGVVDYNEARLGCGFTVRGEIDETGTGYVPESAGCAHAFSAWRSEERRLHVDAVVVEMGYWDEVDWLQDGRSTHIGEEPFDRRLESRMRYFVHRIARPDVPIVFLSVPLVDPAPWPDGSPAPQASISRHERIDSMLRGLAAEFPRQVRYFDLSPYLTPGGRFAFDEYGGSCRTPDGIHLATGPGYPHLYQTRCGARLQKGLYDWLRKVVTGERPAR